MFSFEFEVGSVIALSAAPGSRFVVTSQLLENSHSGNEVSYRCRQIMHDGSINKEWFYINEGEAELAAQQPAEGKE